MKTVGIQCNIYGHRRAAGVSPPNKVLKFNSLYWPYYLPSSPRAQGRRYVVDMSTPFLSEVVPDMDTNPVFGWGSEGRGSVTFGACKIYGSFACYRFERQKAERFSASVAGEWVSLPVP